MLKLKTTCQILNLSSDLIRQLTGKIMREMLEMRETFEALNIIRLKRFKPQAFQASSFKADPDFRQDDGHD